MAFFTDAMQAAHAFMSDPDKIVLLDNTYSPDYLGHATYSQISSAEITSSGYTTGGQELTNKSVGYSSPANGVVLSADPVSWTGLTATVRYAALYRDSSDVNTDHPLIGLFDFNEDRVYDNEPFQLSFPNGVMVLGPY